MISRYRYISNSNLALMPPPQFNPLIRNILNDHHIICLVRNPLQYQILPGWFFNRQQLIFLLILLNKPRILFLTHFTIKLLKIILYRPPYNILLHLRLIPLLQAMEVNQATRTAALAGTAQKLSWLSTLSHHAIFALTMFLS